MLNPAETVKVASLNSGSLEEIVEKWRTCKGMMPGKFMHHECVIAYGKLLPLFPWLKKHFVRYMETGTLENVVKDANLLKHIFAIVRFDASLVEVFNFTDIQSDTSSLANFYSIQILCFKYGLCDQDREDLVKSNFSLQEFQELYAQ